MLFGGGPSDAGVSVTPQTIMEYSPVWSGIGMIASDVAQVPTFVMRKTRDGGKDRATNHPAYKLLRRQASPSQFLSSSIWKEIMVARALLHGNSHSEIIRDRSASPKDLKLLPVSPSTKLEKINGSWWYVTGTNRRKIRPRNVFHLRGPSMEGTGGMSLVEFAKNSIGRGIATDRYASKFFRNSATPSGILSHPGQLGEEGLNNLRQSIEELHGGVANAHRIGVFEEGVTWQALGIDPEKAQMIASLQWSVRDVARWLKMPPHKLGDDSRVSFNSVEQEELSYKFSTLGSWFCKLRDESFEKLLTERQKASESHTVEEKQSQFLAADTKTRHEVYAIGITNGVYNVDEVRNIEGFNPLPEGKGKQHLQPLNMTPIGEEPEPIPPPVVSPEDDNEGDEQSRDVHVDLLRHSVDRALTRLKHVTQKTDGKDCPFLNDQVSPLTEMLGPSIRAANSVGIGTGGQEALKILCAWQNAVEQASSSNRSECAADRVSTESCLEMIGVEI
jgi:HK97 family phage portal protein